MWLIKWLPLFMAGAALESITQVMLKKGALESCGAQGMAYYVKLLGNKWVVGGIAVYFIEMVLWIVILASIPLSIAFPLTGFQKVFVIFFAFFVMKEKIDGREWLGIGLIATGIGIIVLGA